MQTITKLKMAVDVGMTALLPILMAYMLTGQEVHEWVGAAMFALFLLHHGLNIQWWKRVRKGQYTPMRLVTLVLDLLLLVDMVCLMVSGIMMSRYVFGFLPIRGSMALARMMHMAAGYWGFVLMSAHLGMHWIWGWPGRVRAPPLRCVGAPFVCVSPRHGSRSMVFSLFGTTSSS